MNPPYCVVGILKSMNSFFKLLWTRSSYLAKTTIKSHITFNSRKNYFRRKDSLCYSTLVQYLLHMNSGLEICSSVFQANCLFFVSERAIGSWKRANSPHRSFVMREGVTERRAMGANNFWVKKGGKLSKTYKNMFFRANYSLFRAIRSNYKRITDLAFFKEIKSDLLTVALF